MEAVCVDVFIGHGLAPVCGRVGAEQLHEIGGLQDLLALVPRPGGYVQCLRVERGQLAQATVFEEGPHICTQAFERLFALARRIGFVYNLLHVLFGQ